MGKEIFKHSHLETTKDVISTLNWKMEEIENDNLPIDTGVADYIAFSVENLDSQLKQILNVEKELKDRKKQIKQQIESIKIDGAKFLEDMGVSKLNGVYCSSVSVVKAKEEVIKEEAKEEMVYLVDEDVVKELLMSMGYAETREIITEKVTKGQPAKLRINKRKIALCEIDNEV